LCLRSEVSSIYDTLTYLGTGITFYIITLIILVYNKISDNNQKIINLGDMEPSFPLCERDRENPKGI